MRKTIFATAVAAAAAALFAGIPAQALAAPSGTGSAQDTVNSLESNGYRVVVTKVGGAPLDHCAVDSVLPGATSGFPVDQVVLQSVYLTARC